MSNNNPFCLSYTTRQWRPLAFRTKLLQRLATICISFVFAKVLVSFVISAELNVCLGKKREKKDDKEEEKKEKQRVDDKAKSRQ